MKACDAAFRAEADTDRSVHADFTDGALKCEELFRRDEDAGLIEEVLRETRSAQHCRNKDARFFQPQPKTAWYAKVFDHCSTQLSKELCRVGRLRSRQETGKHC